MDDYVWWVNLPATCVPEFNETVHGMQLEFQTISLLEFLAKLHNLMVYMTSSKWQWKC